MREIQPHGEIQRHYPDNRTVERQLFTGETAPAAGPSRFAGQTQPGHWQSRIQVNRAGELTGLTLDNQPPLTVARDEAGRDTGRYTESGFIVRQQYNLMGLLTAQRAGCNPHLFRPAELEEMSEPAYARLARRYDYDAALNLTAASDDGQQLRYRLNGNGQVVSVSDGQNLREHYQYDATGYPARRFDGVQEIMGETLYQAGHRLNWVGSHRFVYDLAGRLKEKQFLAEGHRLAVTKYRWNSQNQLTGLITPDGHRWEYRYDAFGRRTEKRCIQTGKLTTYLWEGDVPAEIREYQHGRLKMIRHLVFDGWELITQQTQQFTLNLDNRVDLVVGAIETQYAVSAPTGEPLALFDPAGKRVWRQPKQSLYGLNLALPEAMPLDPGLRFAGQLFDEESGLCYNRHRYYLPEGCCYLSTDPLGLAGGVNPYSYVQNPTGWVDPLGLNPKDLVRYKLRDTVTPKPGARGTAINRAWGQERTLVTAGGGSRNWTDAERQIILNTKSNRKLASIMSERGYTGHHINSVKGNGTLGQAWKGDPRNIVFLQNANHPSGVDEHLYSNQGHRGSYDTPGNGRLIDREETSKQIVKKCGR
ncbi:RHS repeat-associated core domain-containing protein [Photorhabdus temperata]|uniref:Uncharacterized protein n=1 Tax=Photorhabdus temperata J3 TaxID=1389415 RepID=U7QVV3_PHOTE|nr:hypothetical protein O185_24245 [Photorhabdus temperata J3]